jgi:protein TonB
MAYIQQTGWKDRPGAVAGVIAIHAALAYVLVVGLDFEKVIEAVPRIAGTQIVEKVPLDPPPPPKQQQDKPLVDRPAFVPTPPLDVNPAKPPLDTTPIFTEPEKLPLTNPQPTPTFTPSPKPAIEPAGPKPRGNPASWVSVNDYRTSWIAREMTGTARFRLSVGANGRVESCAVTTSSGYPELDKATCALVAQRARFEPARDGNGAAVAGSYANAVRWELPQ